MVHERPRSAGLSSTRAKSSRSETSSTAVPRHCLADVDAAHAVAEVVEVEVSRYCDEVAIA